MTPAQSKETDGWKTAEPKDDVIRGQWWEMFHEPELNAFESQVNVSNQTVAVALANFLAARAVVKQARSQYFPTVTASPSVTESRQSSPSGSSPTSSTSTEYSLPFDASWEPDFWGRIRNTVKANSLEAQATLADLENVRLTVQAEVAVDYFELRVLDAQKQLLDATVLAYQESLKLTQAQYDAGLASGQDIEQAETQLEITRAGHRPRHPARATRTRHRDAPWPTGFIIFHRDKSADRNPYRDSFRRSVAIARTPPRCRRRRTPRCGSERANRRGACGLFSDHYFERLGGIPEHIRGKSFFRAESGLVRRRDDGANTF